MLKKLFDLLGMSDDYDDEDIVITSHASKEDLPSGDSPSSEGATSVAVDERKERVMRPLPPKAEVVLCRGESSFELLDDVLNALRQGRLVLVDLQGLDADRGNKVLDSLHQSITSSRGALFRVSRTTFLASPVKTACEEWVIEDGSPAERSGE